jgi:hypothetical protein
MGAGVVGVAGLAPLPLPWLGFLIGTLGAVGYFVTQAVEESEPTIQAHRWRLCFLLSLLLPVGALSYHSWFDPATRQPRSYSFVANGDDVNVIPLYGEAGGPEQVLETGSGGQNGLIGGQTYEFDCWVKDGRGAVWLRYERFSRTWWAPQALLHTPTGSVGEQPPRC